MTTTRKGVGLVQILTNETGYPVFESTLANIETILRATTLVWRGEYDARTEYSPGQAVSSGGSSYLSVAVQTGNEPPGEGWVLLARKGDDFVFNYCGVYDPAATYVRDDLVTDDDEESSYVAIGDVPIDTPPPDEEYWQRLAGQGIKGDKGDPVGNFCGPWDDQTVYAVDDVVIHGGGLWIANDATEAGDEPGVSEKWTNLVSKGDRGLKGDPVGNFRGEWDSQAVYAPDDVTTDAGGLYISLTDNEDKQPSGNPDDWLVLVSRGADGPTIVWRGDWELEVPYLKYDVVAYEGSSYLALADNGGKIPSAEPDFWVCIAVKGEDGATINPRGDWNAQGIYAVLDLTAHEGGSYLCVSPVGPGGDPPPDDPQHWQAVALKGDPVGNFRGEYNPADTYVADDVVVHEGALWIALGSVPIQTPPPDPLWLMLVSKGAKGDPGDPGYPTPPVQDGSYRLICTVTEGVPVLSWGAN